MLYLLLIRTYATLLPLWFAAWYPLEKLVPEPLVVEDPIKELGISSRQLSEKVRLVLEKVPSGTVLYRVVHEAVHRECHP